MGFVRTANGDLVALWDIKKIYVLEHEGGGHSTMALMRDGETLELARDYTIAALARALDPVRASR
jgi:hypothetical protein